MICDICNTKFSCCQISKKYKCILQIENILSLDICQISRVLLTFLLVSLSAALIEIFLYVFYHQWEVLNIFLFNN